MNRPNKVDRGCTIVYLACIIVFFAAAALAAGLVIWFWVGMESGPIEGWQEGPRTPEPTTSIHWTPFPTTTSKGTPPVTATP
ncbi:hypothetical protein AB0L06_19765 [Spirillospora sp. NPDC052269]